MCLLDSKDDEERERRLAEILAEQASPLIWEMIRRRLGLSTKSLGAAVDPEDIYQSTMLQLVNRLRDLVADPAKNEIEQFASYVRRLTLNICTDHLRQKAPERFRLKNNLRYQLGRRPEFAIWSGEAGMLFCGLADWPRERRAGVTIDDLADRIQIRPDASLGDLVAAVFREIGAPIGLDELVEIIAAIQGVKDVRPESLESGDPDLPLQLVDDRQRAEEILLSQELIWQVWESLRQYGSKQRLAICLKFTDNKGNTLWSLLCDADLLTPRDIAEELGIPLSELMMLWQQMPMRNADIAAYLKITPGQVSKWRFDAKEKLRAIFASQEAKNNLR